MNKNILFFPLIIFFFIFFIFLYFLTNKRETENLPSALIDKNIPIFKTFSLINNRDFISNKEFDEQTIIVNFFASWCVPCRVEHKSISRLANEKGLKIIGINYKDSPKEAKQWLSEFGNPYSIIAIDNDGSIAIDWGVYGIPETFIVDKKNIIRHRHVGPITSDEYDSFLTKVNLY